MAEEQHFIPKFVLRGFTDPLTPIQQEPYVWVYYFDKNIWDNKAPENIAFKSDFYKYIDNEGNVINEIEGYMSEVEGKTANILRNKICKKGLVTEEDKKIISEFIAFMLLRTPKFRDGLAELVEKETNKIKERLGQDKYEKLQKLFESLFDPKFESLRLMMKKSDFAAKIIFGMTWSFLNSTGKERFITSDNPVSLLCGHSLIDKEAKLVFPFSKEICLLTTWQKEMNHFIDASQRFIKEVNQNKIFTSDNFIISSQQSFIGDEFLRVKKYKILVRFCHLLRLLTF